MVTLADAILDEDIYTVQELVRYEDVNQIDEYGFRPLIEAAIVDNLPIAKFLLEHGANPNLQDLTGGTALHWAAENNNLSLTKLLLEHRADPNAYNLAGQPVLVMPMLRHQSQLKSLLVKSMADEQFAKDFINTKLLGHMFELVGTADIVDPKNHFVEVDFEGFYLEVTIGLILDSLNQFQNHFAARQMRRYFGLVSYIVQIMQRAAELIQYQQYRTDLSKHTARIKELIHQEPLLIPVGYEGHAITFIKFGKIWVKCDRREDSRLYDNVMFYRVQNTAALNDELVEALLYKKQSSEFINEDLQQILDLQPITELKVHAQISGNCSWANVEAAIPSLFFLILYHLNQESRAIAYYKTLALNFFNRWREWNKDRALQFCIQSFETGDSIRKACNAEILVAILFQRCDVNNAHDRDRIESILSALRKTSYEYILKNYLHTYYYQSPTEEGQRFYELLKDYDLIG